LHGLLGGRPPLNKGGDYGGNFSAGAQRTFDHLLADRIGKASPVRNVALAGRDRNNTHSTQTLSWTGPDQPSPPIFETDKLWNSLFAGGKAGASAGDAVELQRARDFERDVLGLTRGQLQRWKSKLGRNEAMQLEAYESHLHEAHASLGLEPASSSAMCSSVDPGTTVEPDYERHHDRQSRTLAAALACGRTRVAVYSMASHIGGMKVSGGVGAHHIHDDSPRGQAHYHAFDVYYGNRIKHLLQELDKYPEGNGTVLDHTLILWTSEMSWTPSSHSHDRLPVYLLGGLPGRKLKMGHYIRVPSDGTGMRSPTNRRLCDVLLTIAHAMGIDDLDGFAEAKSTRGLVRELLT
jgi:hypothetical protein